MDTDSICSEYYRTQIIQMIKAIKSDKILAWLYHFIKDMLKQYQDE